MEFVFFYSATKMYNYFNIFLPHSCFIIHLGELKNHKSLLFYGNTRNDLPVYGENTLLASSHVIILQVDNSVSVLNDGTSITGKEVLNRVLVRYSDLFSVVRIHSKILKTNHKRINRDRKHYSY